MMKKPGKREIFFNIFIFLIFCLLVLSLNFYTQQIFIDNYTNTLKAMSNRIKNDLLIENNKIDTTLYNSDPLTPYPNSSSNSPIYIITTDGYIIERSRPIDGFLDTSDIKHLIKFQQPTTLNILSNENWRVLSKSIIKNDETIGVIIVSYHNPENSIIDLIDNKLKVNIEKLYEQVKIENGSISTQNLDIRKIDYNISFEIVNKSNRVLITNGRNPTFIDPSYVDEQLRVSNIRSIMDRNSKEDFLVLSEPIKSSSGSILGIIIVSNSREFMDNLGRLIPLIGLFLSFLFLIPVNILLRRYLNKEIQEKILEHIKLESTSMPSSIRFDEKESSVFIDNKKVEIAYASNQFYMCKALFSNPEKRWENDELAEEFGEDLEEYSSKKIYDTALALNKKLRIKLISYKDKTFIINPEYSGLIQK